MKALILAGGFGTRLKEVIHDRPKVMAPIDGKPFLEHVIHLLRKNGFSEIIISIGYLGDFIKNYFENGEGFGVKIEYASEDYPLGTGGAIKNAEYFLKETFLVVNGDTYLETNLAKIISDHEEKKSLATIVLTKRKIVSESGLVSLDKSGRIHSFSEKPEKGEGWVNAGYYVFNPKVLKMIKKGERISLEKELFPLLAEKKLLHGYQVPEDFLDIGKPENYEKARKFFAGKKLKIIQTQAPVRISFAGGGTDLPSYFLKHGGIVVSSTINKFSHVLVKENEGNLININLKDYQAQKSFEIGKILSYAGDVFDIYRAIINRLSINIGFDMTVWGDFPGGTGLGTSSSVVVSTLKALTTLQGQDLSKEEIAKLAVEVEREILKIPGGWQDQYACSFGGINLIEFLPKGEVKIKSLNLSPRVIKKLEKSLLLFYIGAKRSEKEQQTTLVNSIKKVKKTEDAFVVLKRLAKKVAVAFKKGKIKDSGNLLNEAWQAKKTSSSKISDPRIDGLYDLALNNGAYGGKLLGAGGGGCLLVCASENKHKTIIKKLKEKGIINLPFNFEFEGVRVKNEN